MLLATLVLYLFLLFIFLNLLLFYFQSLKFLLTTLFYALLYYQITVKFFWIVYADIIFVHILLSELKCKKMHQYIWKKFRIRLNKLSWSDCIPCTMSLKVRQQRFEIWNSKGLNIAFFLLFFSENGEYQKQLEVFLKEIRLRFTSQDLI